MSISLFWEPAVRKKHRFASGSIYSVALERAFGGLPVVIKNGIETQAILSGLIAAGLADADLLQEALLEHDEIEITGEW